MPQYIILWESFLWCCVLYIQYYEIVDIDTPTERVYQINGGLDNTPQDKEKHSMGGIKLKIILEKDSIAKAQIILICLFYWSISIIDPIINIEIKYSITINQPNRSLLATSLNWIQIRLNSIINLILLFCCWSIINPMILTLSIQPHTVS